MAGFFAHYHIHEVQYINTQVVTNCYEDISGTVHICLGKVTNNLISMLFTRDYEYTEVFLGMRQLFQYCIWGGVGVFIWCINQWVDEKLEREDSRNGDYDYDCVIEQQGRRVPQSGYVLLRTGGRGGDKNSLEWISCSFL